MRNRRRHVVLEADIQYKSRMYCVITDGLLPNNLERGAELALGP